MRQLGCSILVVWLLACGRSDVEAPRAPLAAAASRQASSVPLPSTSAVGPLPSGPFAGNSAGSAEPARLVLAAGGDVNLGRECGQAILKNSAYDPFVGLNAAWTSADAHFVNLESQLSEQHGVTQSPLHRLIFTGPPAGAQVLAHASISLVSTANNHAWDYGKGALLETIENLERAQVAFAGTGSNAEQAYRPATLRVNGLSLALFSVTQVWNQPPFDLHEGRNFVAWADVDRLAPAIERARREHDFVIVSYHGGEEYIDAPVERTRNFVSAVMALGVDVVIGHHPHVPQGIGWVGQRPVLYSLGNLVFAGHRERPWTLQSFFARITLQKGLPPRISACPFAIEGHRPRSFDPTQERRAVDRFRQHLIDTSTSTGGAEVSAPDELGCSSVTPRLRPHTSSRSSSN